MIKGLPGGTMPISATLAIAAALGVSGCGTYRSENTVDRKPPPAAAATTAGAPAPKVKAHPGWPTPLNCLAGRGFKVQRTAHDTFVVTTSAGTDTTHVRSFSTAHAAGAYAAGVRVLHDRAGSLVATYGTTAGAVRDGFRSCAHGG